MMRIQIRFLVGVMSFAFGAQAASAQCEVLKFSASDAEAGDYFGGAVAIDGARALVGSLDDEIGGVELGSAYVLERDPGAWTEVAKLLGSDTEDGDLFGAELALDGERAIVGAQGHDHFGQGAGSAYIFERSLGAWVETAELSASDAEPGDFFGRSVSISGTTAVVGAPFEDGASNSVGAVYVYELQGASWVETTKLVAADGGASQRFGASVALEGDRLLVGALGADGVAVGSGAVYVFERQAGVWTQSAKLSPADGAPSDHFGVAVDLEGDRALVGQQAADAGDFDGSAYVFEFQVSAWVQTAKLVSSDQEFFDLFGVEVALTGNTAFVGAPQFGWETGNVTGAAYAFERAGSTWHESLKLLPTDAASGDVFGRGLAADGNRVLIGAIGGEAGVVGSGAVYEFSAATFATLYCLCPIAGSCGNNDPDAGCANSTGSGARLGACGSPSVLADDLQLNASGLPANVLGIVYSGASTISLPFGDGWRCAGQDVVRFPVQDSGPQGAFTQLNVASLGNSLPGQARHFQTWYRDPTGPCASGFNLSSALSLVFTP